MKKDPVCNMEVDERDAVTTECDGVVYSFCSEGCRDKFLRERACKVPRTSYDLIIIGGGAAMFPVLVFVYYRLAKREESEIIKIFGEEYNRYMEKTPMFMPKLGRER